MRRQKQKSFEDAEVVRLASGHEMQAPETRQMGGMKW